MLKAPNAHGNIRTTINPSNSRSPRSSSASSPARLNYNRELYQLLLDQEKKANLDYKELLREVEYAAGVYENNIGDKKNNNKSKKNTSTNKEPVDEKVRCEQDKRMLNFIFQHENLNCELVRLLVNHKHVNHNKKELAIISDIKYHDEAHLIWLFIESYINSSTDDAISLLKQVVSEHKWCKEKRYQIFLGEVSINGRCDFNVNELIDRFCKGKKDVAALAKEKEMKSVDEDGGSNKGGRRGKGKSSVISHSLEFQIFQSVKLLLAVPTSKKYQMLKSFRELLTNKISAVIMNTYNKYIQYWDDTFKCIKKREAHAKKNDMNYQKPTKRSKEISAINKERKGGAKGGAKQKLAKSDETNKATSTPKKRGRPSKKQKPVDSDDDNETSDQRKTIKRHKNDSHDHDHISVKVEKTEEKKPSKEKRQRDNEDSSKESDDSDSDSDDNHSKKKKKGSSSSNKKKKSKDSKRRRKQQVDSGSDDE
jgi:hypothetical protein